MHRNGSDGGSNQQKDSKQQPACIEPRRGPVYRFHHDRNKKRRQAPQRIKPWHQYHDDQHVLREEQERRNRPTAEYPCPDVMKKRFLAAQSQQPFST